MTTRLAELSAESRALEHRLRQGGGADKIERQHAQGKLTARERIARLKDADSMFVELGLMVAHDKYNGDAPAAGVVTGLVQVGGRPCVVVANDATVKAGSWWRCRQDRAPARAGKTDRPRTHRPTQGCGLDVRRARAHGRARQVQR